MHLLHPFKNFIKAKLIPPLLRVEFWLASLVFGLLFFETFSWLSLQLLNQTTFTHPWSFIALLQQGFLAPVFLAFIIISLISCIGYLIYQRHDGLALGASFYLGAFLLMNSVSLYVFSLWHHLDLTPWPWLNYYWGMIAYAQHGMIWQHYLLCLGLSFSLFLIFIGYEAHRYLAHVRAQRIFGKAHFASNFEINQAGLYQDAGIILGKAHRRKLRLQGFESVLLVAPTGSGKTLSLAIPNLLEWEGSGIFNDLKNELFLLTSFYREKVLKNKVYRFAPADAASNTHRYNPFSYVSSNPKLRIRDVQLIAEIIISGSLTGDRFWFESSRLIFIMLALYLLDTRNQATLADIHDLAKQKDFIGWVAEIFNDEKLQDVLSPLAKQNAAVLLHSDHRTLNNILMDFHARMQLYGDPLMRYATSANDFDLSKLRQEKISLYLNIPNSDIERLSPILTLLWAQMIQLMSVKEPDLKTEPYPVLALLDEFGNMGRIPQLRSGITFLRSYRIRCVMMVQYLAQVVSIYGREDARGFLNTKAKIAYALNDLEDAKYFSQCLGQRAVKTKSESVNSGHHAGLPSIGQTTHYQSKPLLSADEVMQLSKSDSIILLEAKSPIRAKKCFWFEDSHYRQLLKHQP